MLHPAFSGLEALTLQETEGWLRAALRGEVMLPRATPDELPAWVITRHELRLPPIARRNLQAAVEALFLEALSAPGEVEETWLTALCDLAVGLELRDLAARVVAQVERSAEFDRWPARQRAALLHMITDLRYPVPVSFWSKLAERDPARYALLTVSALLSRDPEAAIALLPLLPDEPEVAGALRVLWFIELDGLKEARLQALREVAREVAPRCVAGVRDHLASWAPPPAAAPSRLSEVLRRRSPSYRPVPMPARLAA
jgi:hypothetical protein